MITSEMKSYNQHQIAVFRHQVGDNKNIVIFCHGFRGNATGPNRFFVRVTNKLAERGISSLRFDQYGCGNSEGSFENSSFKDWVATTKAIVTDYLKQGYHVMLFGQSMGASTVINVASEIPKLIGFVAWVPDASIDEPKISGEYMEESGQRVRWSYWQEAHDARTAEKLRRVTCPGYIVQCTADEYVDAANRQAIINNADSNITIDNFEGYSHSSWSYDQAEEIIEKSVSSIEKVFFR